MMKYRERIIYNNFSLLGKAKESNAGSAAYYIMDVIDSKTSSLLTHVSIMIDICGFLYPNNNGALYRILILADILTYLLIALICLRTIFVVSYKKQGCTVNNIIISVCIEASRRRFYYKIALLLTITATMFFAAILSYEIILH